MEFKVILLIFVIIIFADKALTYWNLSLASRDNPNYLSMERNPAAKWFFQQYGLLWGSILFGALTLGTLFLMFYLFKMTFGADKTLWTIFIIYGLVIANNTYYLLKNARLL